MINVPVPSPTGSARRRSQATLDLAGKLSTGCRRRGSDKIASIKRGLACVNADRAQRAKVEFGSRPEGLPPTPPNVSDS